LNNPAKLSSRLDSLAGLFNIGPVQENVFEILKSDVLPLLSRDIAQGLGIGEEDQPEDGRQLPIATGVDLRESGG